MSTKTNVSAREDLARLIRDAEWRTPLEAADAIMAATRFVLDERERELLDLKGPCSWKECRLHYAHNGPCDARPAATPAVAE